MEVKLAKSLGYCFGVERAVEKAYSLLDQGKKIYTYGPIIHNETVVSDLEKKGVEIIESIDDIAKLNEGSVVIRAHGVSKAVYDALEEKGLEIIDATCPFVKRIHDIVYKESEEKQIVIAGNPAHPEVEGIMGWCKTPADVISTEEEADAYEPKDGRDVCLVAQTTFNYKKFEKILEIFEKKSYHVIIVNTICNATANHQTEASSIAEGADAMIVIGDKKSSNSRKLYEICSEVCPRTEFIQTVSELKLKQDGSIRKVGITAGASTPNYIIEEVQNYVRREF